MNHDKNSRRPTPPVIQLLTNGRYSVMVSSSGGGSSHGAGTAITRWRDDATRDALGTFCYVRDAASGDVWSTTFQPARQLRADTYDVVFTPGRATVLRRDGDVTIETVIVVSPRTTSRCAAFTSRTGRAAAQPRRDQLCRGRARAGRRGRAPSRVQQPFRADRDPAKTGRLICTRRPRSPRRARALDVPSDDSPRRRSIASSRSRRTACASSAAAARRPRPPRWRPGSLSNTDGSVLDPVVGHSPRITIGPGPRPRSTWSPARPTRARPCIASPTSTRIAACRSRVRADLDAQSGGPAPDERNGGRCPALRAPRQLGDLRQRVAARDGRRARAQPASASRACGRMPSRATCRSSLLQIDEGGNIELVRQLVQAHAYWRLEGSGGRPRDLERGREGYRQVAPGADHRRSSPPASKRTSSTSPGASSSGMQSRSPRRTACCCSRSRAYR